VTSRQNQTKRNADSEEGKPSKRGKRRGSDTVEYLKDTFE